MDRVPLFRLGLNLAGQHGLARLSAATRRIWHRPFRIHFEVHRPCNLRCLHCNHWKRREEPDGLRPEEWLTALRAIRRLTGPAVLSFGSGEPLLYRHITPLIAQAAAYGMHTICVSNGTPVDEALAERLCAARLRVLHLSLDGLRPRTHDLSRGVPGAHAKVLAAVRRLRGRSGAPSLKLNTIVMGHNLGELEGLVRWAAGEGLGGVVFQAMECWGDAWRTLWPPDPASVGRVLDRLIALRREGWPVLNAPAQLEAMKRYYADPAGAYPDLTCGTFTRLTLRDNGDVHLCSFKDSVGNIRRRSIGDIWRSRLAGERVREILDCKKACLLLNCHFRSGLAQRVGEFSRLLVRAPA